ncbi:hypothetical protein DFH09DRAFT_1314063 [Mycena vulgaris]|nr:hypothetical protein DFH09DRAFT_1314063 [Mycena vulgaris]
MHCALGILEVAETVCLQICPDDWEATGSVTRDLAALARTSKVFQEPALNALSRKSQRTFAHILSCIPNDLWNIPMASGGVDRLDVVQPISLKDWNRPRFYLNRIGTLICKDSDTPSAHLFGILSLCLPTKHWFPNVNTLRWTYSEKHTHFPYIQQLLGPRLTTIDIEFNHVIPHFSLIPTLSVKYPRLTKATLVFGSGAQIAVHVRPPSSICNVGSTFEYLALLPTPTSRTVENLQQFTPLNPSLRLSAFLALLKLEFSTESVRAAIDLTNTFSLTTLSEISTLYRTIGERCSHSLLRRLQICVDVAIVGFDLSDDLIWRMACAWPRLARLTIPDGPATTHCTPRATLSALRAFSQHCPNLKHLGMALDASVVPAPESSPGPESVQRALTILSVLDSPITHPMSVARFISGILPGVAQVLPGRIYQNRWKQVEKLLQEFVAGRVGETHGAQHGNSA